jgi:prepilin-type N-terminal cleavage/methylation domain-containing protein
MKLSPLSKSVPAPRGGFTLVELLVVITVISILSVAAWMDYGLAIKKARLQVAVEELLNLFHEGEVYAQSRYVEVSDPTSGEESIFCWSVILDTSSEPRLLAVPWDEATQTCSSDVYTGDERHVADWHSAMAVVSIEWESVSASFDTSTGTTSSIAFLFIPPDGSIQVYTEPDVPTLVSDVSTLTIGLSYADSDSIALTKTLTITPVTASFVVEPGLPGSGS